MQWPKRTSFIVSEIGKQISDSGYQSPIFVFVSTKTVFNAASLCLGELEGGTNNIVYLASVFFNHQMDVTFD